MFVDLLMGQRIAAGQSPTLRPVFRKAHGVVLGVFEIRGDLPQDFRVGLFEHDQFPAVIRFSSDISPLSEDLESTLGMSIKLLGVPGRKLLAEDVATCDFLL